MIPQCSVESVLSHLAPIIIAVVMIVRPLSLDTSNDGHRQVERRLGAWKVLDINPLRRSP